MAIWIALLVVGIVIVGVSGAWIKKKNAKGARESRMAQIYSDYDKRMDEFRKG